MGQELLPPPAKTATSAPARRALLVRERASRQEETPPGGARAARAVKWPIRKLLKGVYLAGAAAKSHRLAAAVLALIVLGLVGSGVIVYRATHPAQVIASQPSVSGPYTGSTPFTIVDSAAPPLPTGVIGWMHGHKVFDAQEVWNTYSADEQQALAKAGTTESKLQDNLTTSKQQGFEFTEFIYSGGYRAPDGTSHYTIELLYSQGGQAGLKTYYFLVGSDGKIAALVNLTPGG
jgi:hypothetical protein